MNIDECVLDPYYQLDKIHPVNPLKPTRMMIQIIFTSSASRDISAVQEKRNRRVSLRILSMHIMLSVLLCHLRFSLSDD